MKVQLLVLARNLFTKLPKNICICYINISFLLYLGSMILQKLQLLLQTVVRTPLAKKDRMITAPGYECINDKNKKVSESFLALNQKKTSFTLPQKMQKCFNIQSTTWNISHSEWQFVFLQTRQEAGFEINLWKLKSIVRSMHKVFSSALKTGMMQ